jgi:type IV secretory pathway VirD2 relaxase
MEDERDFRLRPRKPLGSKSDTAALAFVALMRQARYIRRSSRGGALQPKRVAHQQRCAVRVLYSRNTTRGQWRAHGRYISRESAGEEGNTKAAGFDGSSDKPDIERCLNAWQRAGDERMWKFIISPEFGDRIDLEKLARDVMKRIEHDLDTSLEWIAVAHHNTDYRHVHVALRGVGGSGQALHLDSQYIQNGMRHIAQDLCTRQLGYRTLEDIQAAQQREVPQHRYTSLDRIIRRLANANPNDPAYLTVGGIPGLQPSNISEARSEHLVQRLQALSKMGLAESARGTWHVRSDFDKVLRAMQKSADRQKTLMAHGVVLSDERLPFSSFDFRRSKSVEGRILVHGEEEESGRRYLMLEGTDARVHHIYSTTEIEEARSRGMLRPNSFARLKRAFVNGRPLLEVEDLGNAEELLGDTRHFEHAAAHLLEAGRPVPQESRAGWLGRYQKTLLLAAQKIDHKARSKERSRSRARTKQGSFGR